MLTANPLIVSVCPKCIKRYNFKFKSVKLLILGYYKKKTWKNIYNNSEIPIMCTEQVGAAGTFSSSCNLLGVVHINYILLT